MSGVCCGMQVETKAKHLLQHAGWKRLLIVSEIMPACLIVESYSERKSTETQAHTHQGGMGDVTQGIISKQTQEWKHESWFAKPPGPRGLRRQ